MTGDITTEQGILFVKAYVLMSSAVIVHDPQVTAIIRGIHSPAPLTGVILRDPLILGPEGIGGTSRNCKNTFTHLVVISSPIP